MGRTKPLLPWGGMPLVAWQVEQLQAAGVGDVVVVLGHQAAEVGAALEGTSGRARALVNLEYREGRASSLSCGAKAIPEAAAAVLILGVDQPRPAWVSRAIVDAWLEQRPLILEPRFNQAGGHPVAVGGGLLPELKAVREEDLGLRAVLRRHENEIRKIDVPSAAVRADLNSPEDYQKALAAWEAGEWELASGQA